MSHEEINFIFTAAIFFTVGLTVGAMFMFFKMVNRFAKEGISDFEFTPPPPPKTDFLPKAEIGGVYPQEGEFDHIL